MKPQQEPLALSPSKGCLASVSPGRKGQSFDKLRTTGAFAVLLLLSACRAQPEQPPSPFPQALRTSAPIVSDSFSTEDVRDRVGEFEQVVALARVRPGMSVADVGAGEGYYTVRLSPAVGPEGRVLGQDISPEVRDRLVQRIQRDGLDNVAVQLGRAENPKLPPASFDRIFLVHMYHEVTSPYEFLWHLRDGLKPGGEVIVVDADRPIRRHGIAPALLKCELAAVGLTLDRFARLHGGDSYLAAFRADRPRPAPDAITACPLKE